MNYGGSWIYFWKIDDEKLPRTPYDPPIVQAPYYERVLSFY